MSDCDICSGLRPSGLHKLCETSVSISEQFFPNPTFPHSPIDYFVKFSLLSRVNGTFRVWKENIRMCLGSGSFITNGHVVFLCLNAGCFPCSVSCVDFQRLRLCVLGALFFLNLIMLVFSNSLMSCVLEDIVLCS